jgi:tetratricopeptide (TPR) repeat protein
VVAAVALAGGALVVAWRMPGRAPARVRCGAAGDGVTAVWNDAVRARLAAGFAEVVPFGPDAATRASAAADAWSARWRDTRIEGCRATHERGAQSAAVLDRRMACLDRELTRAGAVLDQLAGGGPRVVAGALDAIDALPSPEACNAARLQAAMPLPTDPRVDAIRADLAATSAAALAGDLPEARRRVDAARTIAEALGHPGLRAEVLLAYAGQQDGLDPKAAAAARERALTDAVTAGDRDLEATATLDLLDAASQASDVTAIATLLPIARAAMARDGVTAALGRAFLRVEAGALIRLGKWDDGLAACDRLAAAEPAPQPAAARCRCTGNLTASRAAESVARCTDALAAAETAYGASHPSTAIAVTNLALALSRSGRTDEALALAQRALAIFEATIPAGHPDLVRLYAVNGNINMAAERWPAVERSMRRCAETALAVYGENHPLRANCLLGLAEYHLADHRPADAVPIAEQALAVLTALEANPTDIGSAHGVLGRALGESGNRKGARAHLDQAIAIFDGLGPGGAQAVAEARRQRQRF